ncbi:TniB family NTP-binding protein [Paracoccus sp. AK26]|uniref:TniB family NTP-binding protein n=1 Tax=Paracoccus sp. AK26 TaxID=2589076 RepID=UPI0014285B6B|nr:TniB family NTP-binding protein [Paracoccus sp. AK26]QIR85100.1 transposase [Paracoccus sp. AK26]
MIDPRTTYLRTARDPELRRRVDKLLRTSEDGLCRPVRMGPDGETRGIIVTGRAGEGKTTLIKRTLMTHPSLKAGGEELPMLHVDVPSPATVKSLAIAILNASGYPEVSDRRQAWNLWNLVRHRLQLLGVRVLWLDEAQDVFRSGKPTEVSAIANTLKSLMKGDGAVSVVLSGLETLSSFVRQDDQLSRRMSFYHLSSLDPDRDAEAVMGLLASKSHDAGLRLDASEALPLRLISACDGRFGLMIELVTEACELALEEGAGVLDAMIMADAWADRTDVMIHENHFLAADWKVLDRTPAQAEFTGKGRSAR